MPAILSGETILHPHYQRLFRSSRNRHTAEDGARRAAEVECEKWVAKKTTASSVTPSIQK
jgi:hypothetical protein